MPRKAKHKQGRLISGSGAANPACCNYGGTAQPLRPTGTRADQLSMTPFASSLQSPVCSCCHGEWDLTCRSWSKWHSICYFLSCSWQSWAGPSAVGEKRASSAPAARADSALGTSQVSCGGGLGQTLIGGVQNQNQTSLTLTFQSSGNMKKQISALKFTHFLTVLLEFNKNVLKITISVISETGFVRKKSFKTSF